MEEALRNGNEIGLAGVDRFENRPIHEAARRKACIVALDVRHRDPRAEAEEARMGQFQVRSGEDEAP